MTKLEDAKLVAAVQRVIEQEAKEAGRTPEQWLDDLMDEASKWTRQNPERAERLVVLADMEERVGRAILDMNRWMDMHPEMPIAEFAEFVRGKFQPN